mgnify:CR=1 FL=1
MANRIKKGDQVVVNTGKDKGKQGEVVRVDGDRVIVSVEGDELVFRVGDYLVAVNPGRHIGAIDVASTAVAPVSESSRVWCGMGSSTNASAACISAGDGDYLIVPPHTFAIWRLR